MPAFAQVNGLPPAAALAGAPRSRALRRHTVPPRPAWRRLTHHDHVEARRNIPTKDNNTQERSHRHGCPARDDPTHGRRGGDRDAPGPCHHDPGGQGPPRRVRVGRLRGLRPRARGAAGGRLTAAQFATPFPRVRPGCPERRNSPPGSVAPGTVASTRRRDDGTRQRCETCSSGASGGERIMPKYLIERVYEVGADDPPGVATRSQRIATEQFPEIVWEHSHVVADQDGTLKSFCVYVAPSEEVVRRHAELLGNHVISHLYEVAGDVTPADFPL